MPVETAPDTAAPAPDTAPTPDAAGTSYAPVAAGTAPGAPVLGESTRLLARLLGEALARHGRAAATTPLDVRPLGVRDAFATEGPPDGAVEWPPDGAVDGAV
ncbi:bacteriocin biosynthesis protein SagD, partial [Streptomyces griseus]|nr:bacteriocin biosynthesis protein SagD [Streptomyces griseus]